MSIIKYRNKNINSKLKIHSNVLLSLIFALIPEISKEITIRKTKNQSNSVQHKLRRIKEINQLAKDKKLQDKSKQL